MPYGADPVPRGIITSIRAKRKIGKSWNTGAEISETCRRDARDNPALSHIKGIAARPALARPDTLWNYTTGVEIGISGVPGYAATRGWDLATG